MDVDGTTTTYGTDFARQYHTCAALRRSINRPLLQILYTQRTLSMEYHVENAAPCWGFVSEAAVCNVQARQQATTFIAQSCMLPKFRF
jgi:hypothetical protein